MQPKQKKRKTDAQRLAKSLQSDETNAGHGRTRKNPVRPKSRRNAGRTMAVERELSPLARLMGALKEEKIDFMLIGMSAAVLQGVPGSTLDVDYWVDLPSRQYMRVLNVCRQLGSKLLANTVVELEDSTLVNFIYSVTGLKSFAMEKRNAKHLKFGGLEIAVLPLQRVLHSKESIRRPKDLVHIELIQQTIKTVGKMARREKRKK